MKILTVSDYVEPGLYRDFDAEKFREIDLILSCGDLPPEYLTFLSAKINAPLWFVRGNHDIRYIRHSPDGCRDLDGELIRFRGLRIMGLEGSRWYNGNPCQYSEKGMRAKIRKLRFRLWWWKGVDIIITHAPPRFIHDEEDLCHRGFRCFRKLINRYQPRYFIHGHIHRHFDSPEQRITRVGRTKIINTYGHYILNAENSKGGNKTV
ncbi:MAG: metallophosphoesterase [Desulfococcaceae bacterium]|jgi:Icc-related predicted phosphoesterase|nr:metallophosphoesterase [Desulfococcaceae bacterium]